MAETVAATLQEVPTQNVTDLATKLAHTLAAELGEGSSVQPMTLEVGAGGAGFNGHFELDIVYKNPTTGKSTTFKLELQVPTEEGKPYVVSLTETPEGGTAGNIASFKFVPSTKAFSIGGGLPFPITIGSVTVSKLDIGFGKGEIPNT